jgi:hypothetical protein
VVAVDGFAPLITTAGLGFEVSVAALAIYSEESL